MSAYVWGLDLILLGACLIKLGQWWLAGYLTRTISIVHPGPDRGPPGNSSPGAAWPSVLVVIPARNEQRDLSPCLDAVLAQDYPNFAVLIVDDRSQDRTAAIVREYQARDARVTLAQVASLPPGWTGKAHAMWYGTRQATADWLLFIDADVTLEPCALRGAMEESLKCKVALLSAFPRAAREGFWQQLALPLLGSMLLLWYRPDWVNDPAKPIGLVNGQFLLVRRDEYERIDGHRSVRDTLIEDVPFGGVAKRAGVACRLAFCGELAKIRMYTDFRGLVDGFPRIFIGALRSRAKLLASAFGLLMNLSTLVFILILAVPAATGSLAWWSGATLAGRPVPSATTVLLLVCALDIAVSLLLYMRLWRGGHLSVWWVLLYPLALLLSIGIFVRAWWWLTTGRIVTWRGTSYQIDRTGRLRLPEAT
jgi:glycosyltransferase involved in cell wall biosynthesis